MKHNVINRLSKCTLFLMQVAVQTSEKEVKNRKTQTDLQNASKSTQCQLIKESQSEVLSMTSSQSSTLSMEDDARGK